MTTDHWKKEIPMSHDELEDQANGDARDFAGALRRIAQAIPPEPGEYVDVDMNDLEIVVKKLSAMVEETKSRKLRGIPISPEQQAAMDKIEAWIGRGYTQGEPLAVCTDCGVFPCECPGSDGSHVHAEPPPNDTSDGRR
jgi:hypothetical protein